MKKPACKLIGEDGNVFSIISRVCTTLRRSGQWGEAEKFKARAIKSKSYDEVLSILTDYVVVE